MAAPIVPDFLTVQPDSRPIVDRPEVQQQVASAPGIRHLKPARIPDHFMDPFVVDPRHSH